MVEEVLSPGQQIVADPEVLKQSFRGELDDGCTQMYRVEIAIRTTRLIDQTSATLRLSHNSSRYNSNVAMIKATVLKIIAKGTIQ